MLALVLIAVGAIDPAMAFPNSMGRPCEAAYRAERLRGGRPTTAQQSPSNGSAAFVGQLDGRSAFITYECDNGAISQHGIIVSFCSHKIST